jgi:hypothetical protein
LSFAQSLDSAVGAAVCNWLNTGGNAVLGNAVLIGLATPGGTVPSVAAGLGLLALNYGCSFDPNNTGVASGAPTGCYEASATGYFNIERWMNGSFVGSFISDVRKINSVTSTQGGTVGGDPWFRVTVNYVDKNNATQTRTYDITPNLEQARNTLKAGTCVSTGGTSTGKLPTYTYTDTTTTCKYVVEFQSWAVTPDGNVAPVVKISPPTTTYASGGIISGCNFQPVLYTRSFGGTGGGGGGGGGWYGPWTPGPNGPDGEPWWWPHVQRAIDTAIGAVVAELARQLLGVKVGAKTYRLVSVCETNANGEAISQSREVQIPDLSINQAAIYRLDAIEYLLQGLKDFKQPVCNTRPTYSGTPVTVRFQSDAPSPAGERPLLKRLRYRDTLSNPLEVHTDHWADFQWDAGPVIVTHTGGPWGVCKVWAASVDEGKRVIRHAGVVAGVDPDSQGRWIVSGSADPRYGQTGRMRVQRRSGAICVSSRPGPSGLPLIAYPSAHS